MKHITRSLPFILVLGMLLISACAGAAPLSNSAGDKVQSDLVEFSGVLEAMNGSQWTINGQIVTVGADVIRDGLFRVGDTVKLEARVAQDGSVMVTRLETPSAPAGDSGNSNTNEAPVVVAPPSNPSAIGNPQTIIFDDSGSEVFGSVDSITTDAVVIGGQTFAISNSSEFKGQIQAGDFAKVHFALNADGTYSIIEIETWDPALVTEDNSNSNSNSNLNSNGNSNDDNGNDDNSNGDNGNDDSGDDDNGNDNGSGGDDDDNGEDNSGNGDD